MGFWDSAKKVGMAVNPITMGTALVGKRAGEYFMGSNVGGGGGGFNIGDEIAYAKEEKLRQQREDEMRSMRMGIAQQLRDGGFDQGTADRNYAQATQDFAKNFGHAADSAAANAARRGIGNSGLATAMQNQINLDRSNAESGARLDSIDAAIAERRGNLMSAMGAYGGIANDDMSLYTYEQNRRDAARMAAQERADMWKQYNQNRDDEFVNMIVQGGAMAGGMAMGGGMRRSPRQAVAAQQMNLPEVPDYQLQTRWK